MAVSSQAKQDIDSILANIVQRPNGVPGIYFKAIDKQGQILYEKGEGATSVDDPSSKIKADTVMWVASLSKLVTAIAVMQLVEQGKVSLDDPADIVKYLPELEHPDIIVEATPEKVTTKKATKKITVKQLLNHTAGFSYPIWDARVLYWATLNKVQGEITGDVEPEWWHQPLVAEPGTAWHYGTNIDMAGAFLTRVTGSRLGTYFAKNIFEPLGLKDTYFGDEREHDKARLSAAHMKSEGVIKVTDHYPMVHKANFQAGGSGLLSTIDDYSKILGAVLNDGVGQNGTRILKVKTVDLMFRGSIAPEALGNLEKGLVTVIPPMSETMMLYPGTKKNWGLSFLITEEELATGRGAGAGHWAGLANWYWTIDRKKGVACLIGSQLLPFADPLVLKAFHEAEAKVYSDLAGLN